MITLRYIDRPGATGRNSTFKTLEGARKRAHKLVGHRPRLDPDGYAVARLTGNCLFFKGATFEELFPPRAETHTRSYLGQPPNPLSEMFEALTGRNPPAFVKGLYSSQDLTDEQMTALQDWCSMNVRPNWGTGIGLLEAADQMVQEAVNNGNIPPDTK